MAKAIAPVLALFPEGLEGFPGIKVEEIRPRMFALSWAVKEVAASDRECL
jgi:hypothetical protein